MRTNFPLPKKSTEIGKIVLEIVIQNAKEIDTQLVESFKEFAKKRQEAYDALDENGKLMVREFIRRNGIY
jgi:hypothetical protein